MSSDTTQTLPRSAVKRCMIDGRTRTAKRLLEIERELAAAAGGEPTFIQALLISKAAALCLQLEGLKLKISNNKPVDQDLFLRMCGTFARLLERIEAKAPKPEPVEDKKPYWEPRFHEMTDADFWKWIEERGVTSDACATEKRARDALRAQEARVTPEERAYQQEMRRRMWTHEHIQGVQATSTHKEKNSERDEGESANSYADCGVEL